MANPNRTVAAARNQKTYCVEEIPCESQSEAEARRDEVKASGRSARVSRYKIGPRNNPTVKYMVRVYA